MTHIMLDLETWGTRPGSALRSIGAVVFDPKTGPTDQTFYHNISDQSCLELGMTKDPATVAWWDQQSQASRDQLLVEQQSFSYVAYAFTAWFRKMRGKHVWSQGANFDVVLWEASCFKANIPVPWQFYNVRDTRTKYEAHDFNPKSVTREGTYHNALDDAIHQAWCVHFAANGDVS